MDVVKNGSHGSNWSRNPKIGGNEQPGAHQDWSQGQDSPINHEPGGDIPAFTDMPDHIKGILDSSQQHQDDDDKHENTGGGKPSRLLGKSGKVFLHRITERWDEIPEDKGLDGCTQGLEGRHALEHTEDNGNQRYQ